MRWHPAIHFLLFASCVAFVAAILAITTYAVIDDPAPPPMTVDARRMVADTERRLRAEIARLEAELDKSNRDQLDLRRTVTTIEQRASRSSRTPRVAPTASPVRSSGPGCGFPVPAALDRIARCESHCNPLARNRRSSAAGAFQTLTGTWGRYGGYPTADAAPLSVQIEHALALYNRAGTRPWNASRGCWS